MNERQLQILLVDDDEEDYLIIRDLLSEIEETRHHLEWVPTFEAGLDMMKRQAYDVYLVDYRLGDRDGLELLRQELANANIGPIIILTGQGNREVDLEAMRIGAADYLVKGQLSPALLERSMRYALERRRAEQALRASERKLRNFVESSLDGITMVNEQGIIVEWSPGQERITGLERTEALGKPIWDVQLRLADEERRSPALLELTKSLTLRLLETGDWPQLGQTEEMEIQRLDGTKRTIQTLISPIQTHKGFMVSGIVRDITHQKKMEQDLFRLKRAVECSGEVVFLTDRDGIITYVNTEFTRLYGYSAEEVVGKTTPRVLNGGAVAPEDFANLWVALLSGQSVKWELANRAKDGRLLPIESSANPIIDEGHGIVGFLAIQRDISERKLAEATRAQSLEQLQRTIEKTVQAMASLIEIRDPYTSGHQRRVANLAGAVGREMGLSEDQIRVVHLAALVHDVGKMVVPAEILSKPGRITETELNLIRTHPQVAFDILDPIEFPWPIARIALQHHERLDGSGYPFGLTDGEILLEARIIAVADVVEAMSSHRPYRPALGIDSALEEISHNSGKSYDSEVATACLRLFTENGYKL